MAEEQLTEEQIEELNKIANLPKEKQQQELARFLKKLTPGQIEFLKRNQVMGSGGGCIFCSIVEGKVSSKVVYEDGMVLAILDINPASRGHTLVLPKKHYVITAMMPDKEIEHLFKVANKISKELFESLKAEGSNILVANGQIAGQNVGHVVVHVIPRYNGDGLDFGWQGKKMEEKELDEVRKKLAGKITFEQKTEKIEKKKIEKYDEEERLP